MGGSAHTAPAREPRSQRTDELLARARAATGAERRRLLDEVVVANLPVARSIARRYRNRGVPLEDLEQVACLALTLASRRFDPDKADDFLTFAVPTITGEVKRYFRDSGWAIRPPRHIQEIQALIGRHDEAADDHETPEQTAARLDLPVKDVTDARLAFGCFAPSSLDAPAWHNEEGPDTRGTYLVDEEQFHDWNAAEARAVLRTLSKELTARERLILYLRFVEDRTQADIGEELGVTQMQVSRLLAQILAKMRVRLEDGQATGVA
jgi:RNA polymerase sigma-B factor